MDCNPIRIHVRTMFCISLFLVSSWRLFNKKSFSCYAVYIDCPTIDSTVGTPILKLFTDLGIKCDSKYVFSYVNNSNLYI